MSMWRLQSYDSSTDEEEEVEIGGSHIPGLVDKQSTFLLGTTTRFGQQTRINNTLRADGFSYAKRERNHCEQLFVSLQ